MGQSTPIGTRTILVVENEALLRFDVTDFFVERGWAVHATAEQALAVLDHHGAPRAALTDMRSPGVLDGLALAHILREPFPPTLLFIVSDQAPPPPESLPARATFLPKPFDLHRVLRQIEREPIG